MEADFQKDIRINLTNENLNSNNPKSMRTQHLFQGYIFVLTFFTYASLHTTREAWAFLKDNIKKEDSPGIGLSSDQLGTIDMVFLGFYSIGLYISGVLGDNMNKKLLIGVGYIIVCAASVMIGMGGIWQIRNQWYYILFFSISGIVQSVGWPSVVAIMANWFSKKGRGFWFGIWTANPNVGNIIGTLSCNLFNGRIGLDWRWTWIIVSLFVGVIGLFNLFFMVEHPAKVGIIIKEQNEDETVALIESEDNAIVGDREEEGNEQRSVRSRGKMHSQSDDTLPELVLKDGEEGEKSINFFKAWLIPGVIQFSICYLGLKLANYGIMLWLPTYATEHLKFNEDQKTLIALLYDIGTVAGSICLGLLSDLMYGRR